MFSEWIGKAGKKLLNLLVFLLSKAHINPNFITLLGFLINVLAAYYLYRGRFVEAGWIIVLAGAMDMLDGAVAKTTKTASDFGAFFDSVIDRYSDMALYLGLIVYYGKCNRMGYVDLVGLCIMGSVLTSYARARAECLIEKCNAGFLERPERVVLLILGAWFNRMEQVLWVIAVLSNWAVISRMLFTYKQLPRASFMPVVRNPREDK